MESMEKWQTARTIPHHKEKKMSMMLTTRLILVISKTEPLIGHNSHELKS